MRGFNGFVRIFSCGLLILSGLLAPASRLAGQDEFPAAAEAVRIDRSLQLIVFPQHVRLQYDLGLGVEAANAFLERTSGQPPGTTDPRGVIEAVREVVRPEIARRCRLEANDVPLQWEFSNSLVFPKHYVQLSCIFEAALPADGQTIRLEMVDGSFRGYDGVHMVALKTEGGVQLQSSTVPLILARVPRQSLRDDTAAQREAARRAEAVVFRPNAAPADSAAPSDDSTDEIAARGNGATGDGLPPHEPLAGTPVSDALHERIERRWVLPALAAACGLVVFFVLASLAARRWWLST